MPPHERVLFVGIGGGNDAFSTTLAAWSLQQSGWRWKACAFAGVLSPFHHHTTVETDHPGLHRTTPATERRVVRADGHRTVGFIDATIAGMLAEAAPCGVSALYGLSLAEGAEGLTRTFRSLAREFDFVVLVDVGGDCFYRGARDRHVISPMFDALVVRGFVDSGVPGVLFEAGPGTDGELDPDALEEVFDAAGAEAFPLQASVVDDWERLYLHWIAPKRTGNTVPRTIEAFRSLEAVLERVYRVRAHLGDHRRYHAFTQRIRTDLCRQFFLVDPARIRNPFAVAGSSPLDWFFKTQVAQHRTNCEANLEYVRDADGWGQFLTPSPLFPDPDRRELLTLGMEQLIAGAADHAWLFPNDWEYLAPEWEPHVTVEPRGGRLLSVRPRTREEVRLPRPG